MPKIMNRAEFERNEQMKTIEKVQTERIIDQATSGILQKALEEERALDAQLKDMENLDEDDFESLRQKRKLQLQKKLRQEQDWRQLGHGRYSECNDTKDFFQMAKKSSRMCVHFYRGVTPRCQIVDAHFERLAQTHVETRFIKIDAEKSPYLVEKLGIILLPTIVLIREGRTEHSIRGFDEFGGTDDFTTSDMAWVLSTHGVLNFEEADRAEQVAQNAARAGVNAFNLSVKSGEYAAGLSDDDDFTVEMDD